MLLYKNNDDNNPLFIPLTSSLLFLKEYNFNEAEIRSMKRKSVIFLFIWALFPLAFRFGMHTSHPLILFIFFLIFTIYHWFILTYISKFAKRHIGFLVLFLPMSYYFTKNLIILNKPTYYGAMDGFASLATMEMQLFMLVIFPTFMFSLRMVKVKNSIKGIVLMLITLISGTIGVKQCMGKEGYLSDSTGNVFAVLVIISLIVSFWLINNSNKMDMSKYKL